ncbi:MAG: energy transducer TonB [Terriglobales bacterium]|jgi:TonB family protein
MRRVIVVSASLLIFVAAQCLTTLAQETQADSPRKIVNRAMPVYPELARKMALEGTVKLQVTVAPNGTVKSVQAVGGSPVLVKAAEDSVYKFRWIPAKQESKELIEMRFHPE